jgi:Pectate lyase superfamily protein
MKRLVLVFIVAISAAAQTAGNVQTAPGALQSITQPDATHSLSVNHLNIMTDPDSTSSGSQAATMNTIRAESAVSVKLFGAKGNGATDDTAALNRAFAFITSHANSESGLYFPCGTYIVGSALVLTYPRDGNAGYLIGENHGCVYVQYTGSVKIEAVMKVWSGSEGDYFYNFSLRDITFLGNANTTYDFEMIGASQFYLANIRMWGANASTGACMNIVSAVEGTIVNAICNRSPDVRTKLPFPAHGLIFDGNSSLGAGLPTIVISPEVSYVSGVALWIKSAGLMTISGGQISGDGVSLRMEATASNIHIDSCLFESGPSSGATGPSIVDGTANVIENSSFVQGSYPYGLHVNGYGNTLTNVYVANNGSAPPLIIESSARQTTLSGIKLSGRNSLSDQGSGTEITNLKSDNSTIVTPQDNVVNVMYPSFHWNGIAGNTKDTTTEIRGTYSFGTTPVVLSPTIFTAGKSWRAIFIGEWQNLGGSVSTQTIAPYVELTESNNTMALPTGFKVTFSINGRGQFQATSTAECCQVFQGVIFFIPNLTPATSTAASGQNSEMLSGGISAGDTSVLKGVTINRSVTPDGSGAKHIRVLMCMPVAGAFCDTALRWATPFADADYTLSCTLDDDRGNGQASLTYFAKTAAGATLRLSNISGPTNTGVANCIAMHD